MAVLNWTRAVRGFGSPRMLIIVELLLEVVVMQAFFLECFSNGLGIVEFEEAA